MNLHFKPTSAERMERCVLCGRVIDVPVSPPVAEQTHYVDGAGELRWISEPAAL